MCGVLGAEVDVAHGVIDLVEVVLVLVAACHALEASYHLSELALVHNLCLHDAGVEGHFVGRVGTYDARECLVGQGVAPRFVVELCEQEVESCLG